MDFQRFSAKTVGDAVTAACQHFLVTSDKLEYEILEEGSTGFLEIQCKTGSHSGKGKGYR